MVRKMRLMIREVKKETGWDDLEKEYRDTRTDVNQTLNGIKKDVDVSAELKDASAELDRNVKSMASEFRRTGEQIGQEAKELQKETEKQ